MIQVTGGIMGYLYIYIYMGILGLFIPLIYQVGEISLVLCWWDKVNPLVIGVN